jgi:hypothetical protein
MHNNMARYRSWRDILNSGLMAINDKLVGEHNAVIPTNFAYNPPHVLRVA